MATLRQAAIRGVFELLWATRTTSVVRAMSRARGIIFTLHRVLPEDPPDFSPNTILQVKPAFLDYAIRRVRALGFETVDLDEALRRLESGRIEKRFAVFTFDDAYRDNLRYALPVLRKHQCPFTLYVPTAFVDGVGELWWQALEDIIAKQSAIALTDHGETDYIPTATLAEKRDAFDLVYGKIRSLPEPERGALIRDLAAKYDFDLDRQCRDLIMDWQELRGFAREQLCTLGAHTVHHYQLAKLPAEQAASEIEQSLKVMEAQFGRRPIHFSYPYGSPDAAGPREYQMAKDFGLRSAVTTIPGGLYRRHRESLTSLPRVSLNGLFQARRYMDVFATPAIFTALGRRAMRRAKA